MHSHTDIIFSYILMQITMNLVINIARNTIHIAVQTYLCVVLLTGKHYSVKSVPVLF